MRRTLVVITAVLVGAGSCASLAWADSRARELRAAAAQQQRGQKAMLAGDYEAARTHFSEALEILPAFPEAHLGLGHLEMAAQHFDAALAEYTAARDGYSQLGAMLFDVQVDRYRDAQREITVMRDQLRELQSGRVKLSEGASRTQEVRMEDAIRKLEAVQMPDKSRAGEPPGEVYFFIGTALFRLNRLDDAVQAWEQAARLNPAHAACQNNLAVAYWKQGRVEQARAALAQAEQLGATVNPQFKSDLERAAGAPPAR
ncbi:MAG: tetratricopeptide repeat protein [Acidobacteria bacterium]|nr:tetratricopeptide repeat protein [Acidobacteriota bacterium]